MNVSWYVIEIHYEYVTGDFDYIQYNHTQIVVIQIQLVKRQFFCNTLRDSLMFVQEEIS